MKMNESFQCDPLFQLHKAESDRGVLQLIHYPSRSSSYTMPSAQLSLKVFAFSKKVKGEKQEIDAFQATALHFTL